MTTDPTLAATDDRFRHIAETANEGIWLVNTDGITVFANERLAVMLATDLAALEGRAVLDFCFEEDRPLAEERIARNIAGDTEQFEFRFRRADGEAVHVLACTSPVHDTTGAVVGALGMFTDISERYRAEEAVRASETRMRTLLEHLPVAVWLTDAEGEIVVDNPAGERIWGTRYRGQEHAGRTRGWWTETGEPLAPADWSLARALAAGEAVLDELIDIEAADGARRTIRSSAVPVKDGDGRIQGAVVINEDVTARRRAELALRESDQRFAAAFAASPHLISISTLDDGRYVAVNDAVLENTGYTREEMIGRTSGELGIFPNPEGRRLLVDALRDGPVRNLELEIRGKDDSRHTILLSADVITLDGRRCILTTSSDITERKRAEAERERLLAAERVARLEAERARARTALLQQLTADLARTVTVEEVAGAIVERVGAALGAAAGAFGRVTEDGAALAVIRAFGYPDALVETWRRAPLDRRAPYTDAARTSVPVWIASPEELAARYPAIAARRPTEYASSASVPLIVEGRVIGVLGLSFAAPGPFVEEERGFLISLAQQCAQALDRAMLYQAEREARARAESAVRLRDHVLASVSHDLRTPLTTVRGLTQMLRRQASRRADPADAALLDVLGRIERSAGTMALMLSEILDAARLQMGEPLPLERRALDLVALVRGCVETQHLAAPRHRIALTAPDTPIAGEWDPVRLERVVTNLLSNAVKYSPDGGAVSVSLVREAAPDGDRAVLTVRDEGIGIPAADLPHIFDGFRRGANVGAVDGTGIGLAGAKQIVEQHGGTIAVTSVEGSGTTFTVRLPLAE